MEDQQLLEAIENIRRDKHEPWRYILFTLLNGIAQGVGMALGATVFLGITIAILNLVLSHLVGFPILGYYATELTNMLNAVGRHTPRHR
ncbi:MAG: DUF5665 domain-containing protein [Candidatus Margulisbacteria bacterium]|jgi:hypothetical protein|nr:DUF5665 domain-containing protein [Candidatus Margulisiibacteriota bacterium]